MKKTFIEKLATTMEIFGKTKHLLYFLNPFLLLESVPGVHAGGLPRQQGEEREGGPLLLHEAQHQLQVQHQQKQRERCTVQSR